MLKITKNKEKLTVYDITVPETSNFYANNILVHNCVEITLPTKPLKSHDDEEAEIALCILAAINMGKITKLDQLESKCKTAVWVLDELIDYQKYPIPAAERATRKRRPLGVGVINFAYYLAKNGVKYSDPAALRLTHEFFEAFQYYLIKASVELAKIKGPCEGFKDTKYAQGILPIDTYKKSLDEIVDSSLNLDWEKLRQDVLTYGMRNSTLSALMPAETSAQISNATNGIEPPRSLVSIKGSKQSAARQVVPDIEKLSNKYECLFDMPNMDGYIKLVGIMQKFVDQSISGNTSYDPSSFDVKDSDTGRSKLPLKTLVEDFLKCYKYGWKTGYYNNVDDGRDEEDKNVKRLSNDSLVHQQTDQTPTSASIKALDDDDCDSCKI